MILILVLLLQLPLSLMARPHSTEQRMLDAYTSQNESEGDGRWTKRRTWWLSERLRLMSMLTLSLAQTEILSRHAHYRARAYTCRCASGCFAAQRALTVEQRSRRLGRGQCRLSLNRMATLWLFGLWVIGWCHPWLIVARNIPIAVHHFNCCVGNWPGIHWTVDVCYVFMFCALIEIEYEQ
jgi:hypothetical protein